MVRTTKKPTKTESDATVAPVTVTATPAKTVSKTVKKPKTVDTVKAVEPESVAVVQTASTEDAEPLIAEQSTEFLAKLQQIGALLSALKSEYRAIEKKWTRELKTVQKLNSKRKRKTGNRQPSGFVKPTKISDELAKFLGKDIGSEMARTEVTRDINKYIRTHSLQDSTNGRKINPDAKLAALLKLKKTDELTYFNLQRYMSPHFAKAIPKAVAEQSVSL